MLPEKLKDSEVMTKANVYFGGRCTSRTCYYPDGKKFTLGIITPGSYTFSVGDREVVQLIAGTVEIQLPTETAWRPVSAPDSFEVAANCEYGIRSYDVAEYLCDYYPD